MCTSEERCVETTANKQQVGGEIDFLLQHVMRNFESVGFGDCELFKIDKIRPSL